MKEQRLITDGLHWLGLFSNNKMVPRDNSLLTLCTTLKAKRQY